MLSYQLQTKTYGFGDSTKIIAESDGTSVFYNLTWSRIYELNTHPFKLRLTSYGKVPRIEEIENHNGFWSSPQDVWYSKIELIRTDGKPAAADDNIAGVISFCTEKVENANIKLSNQTKSSRFEYIMKNTKKAFLTVPAGKQLEDVLATLGSKGIYEYYGAQYCRQNGANETEDENKIQIWGNNEVAAQSWVTVLPHSATSQMITKGDNVRLDVYLRYWTAKPGELI